jgi:hypothetical protein
MGADADFLEFIRILRRMVSADDMRGIAEAFAYASEFLTLNSSGLLDKLAGAIISTAEAMVSAGKDKKLLKAISESNVSPTLQRSLRDLYNNARRRTPPASGKKGEKKAHGEARVPLSAFSGGWKPPSGSPFAQFLPLGDGIANEADLFGASQILPKRAPQGPPAVPSAGFGGECIVPKKKPPSHTETRGKMMAFLKRVREKGKGKEGLPFAFRERSRGRR